MNGCGRGRRILDEVSDRITRITSGRMVLFALSAYAVLLILINGRPFGVAQLKEITGGIGILDLEILYTPEHAYALFSAMEDAGRAFDLTHIVPLDMVFPFVYTLFYAVTITWLLHKWLPAQSRWHRLNVVPVVGGICDYMENLGIIMMLLSWPAQLPDIARFTMVMGLVKWTFGILVFVIILGALIGWVVYIIKGRSGRSPSL
jgi:hypothetical protein